MTLNRVIVSLLIIGLTGSVAVLSMAAVFAFREFGLSCVTMRVVMLAYRRGSFNVAAAVIRKFVIPLIPARLKGRRRWFLKGPSVTSTLSNLVILLPPVAVCAGYGLAAWGLPPLLFSWLVGSLKGDAGTLDGVMLQATLLTAIFGSFIGAFVFLRELVTFRRVTQIRALTQLSRHTSDLSRTQMLLSQYNMLAYAVIRPISGFALLTLYLFFGYIGQAPLVQAYTSVHGVARYDFAASAIAVFIAVALSIAAPILFRRRMAASAALIAIMKYRGDSDETHRRVTTGSLAPVTDPIGAYRMPLAKLAAALERYARTFDRYLNRFDASPLVAALLRAACRDIQRTMRNKKTLESSGFDDLHSMLDRLAVFLAAPGDVNIALTLSNELGVYDIDGQLDLTLTGKAPSRLVAVSYRLNALAEFFERPVRLIRVFVAIAIIGVAFWWMWNKGWDPSLLTNLK